MNNTSGKQDGKVLICVPKLSLPGGVAQYNRTIREFLPANYRFFERAYGRTLPGKVFAAVWDMVRYMLLLCFENYRKVCLNPSLGPTAVKRDGVYAFIAKKIFRKKVILFWHGWNPDFAAELEAGNMEKFRKNFFLADKMLVLHSQASNSLKRWGYNGPVSIVTTCFEKCFDDLPLPDRNKTPYKVLFLARVEKAKGIMIALEVAQLLADHADIPVELIVAGDGSALAEAKEFVQKNQLQNVKFAGFVQGQAKIDHLLDSHIFLQSSYHEGLPCSLLEAMACGLPAVTSAVGGIVDFFADNKMGFMLKTMEAKPYAEKILELLRDQEKMKSISEYNFRYAQENFTARQAAARQCAEIQTT